MQITVDPLALTKEQREALAGFILTFPQSKHIGEDKTVFHGIPKSLEDYRGPMPEGFDNLIEVMEKGQTTPSPEVAFGGVKSSDIAATVDAGVITGSVDKSGLPWDERIHSSNRALTAEGFWRKRRGVDDATVAQVENQLKQLMAIPSPTQAVASTPLPTVATAQPDPSVIAPVIPPPPIENASPIPLPPASTAETTPVAAISAPSAIPTATYTPDTAGFLALISRASALMTEGKLTQDEITVACTSIGIPSFPMAGQRLDLVPQLAAIIEATVNGRA